MHTRKFKTRRPTSDVKRGQNLKVMNNKYQIMTDNIQLYLYNHD